MTCPVTGGSVWDYPFGDRVDLSVDPTYAKLRAREPVARVRMPHGGQAWLLTRHEDIREALTDPRLSLHAGADWDVPRVAPRPLDSVGLMGMPPEQHRRLRRLVSRAFTPRRVADMLPEVERITEELVDGMVADGGPVDLVARLALPLPTRVICRMLGVPVEDQDLFRRFSDALMSSTRYTEAEITGAMEQFSAYLYDLAAKRRAEPEDDLLSALIQVSDDEGRLTEPELLMLIGGLLVGGHETTANQLAGNVLLLLREPEHYQRLCAEPELIPTAVEELLRYLPLWSSVPASRVATEDLEIAGVRIRAGEAVVYSLTSANRDGEVFDDPDTFSLERDPNPHLSFSKGPHYCVGAALARMELQCATEALVTRIPKLRLAVPENEIGWHRGMLIRSPQELLVTW
ncbi:cytochrome P450 [Nocardiopsis sp. EMB25]|uniref:cytochrome P450 n=1 Tax=Nocardiopsis sp. EMB25 TaxID=2835867 RepID=UPI00228478F6|nr:cytochrome P450 [Nocardiopsis sp. EMB25]MCY9787304.1 cytochrome P450 [Nocardiopsis sp. EMB25]